MQPVFFKVFVTWLALMLLSHGVTASNFASNSPVVEVDIHIEGQTRQTVVPLPAHNTSRSALLVTGPSPTRTQAGHALATGIASNATRTGVSAMLVTGNARPAALNGTRFGMGTAMQLPAGTAGTGSFGTNYARPPQNTGTVFPPIHFANAAGSGRRPENNNKLLAIVVSCVIALALA